MTLVMVAIKDRALDAFMRPFFAQTTGQAIRMFNDEINNSDSPMFKHPEDYDLYYLGIWDDKTGMFEEAAGEQIARGKNASLRDRAG